jgi:hypothetical protein
MRRALHLGVQKALGIVASRYHVDLEAVSTGYVVSIGVDDEVAMNRVDTLPLLLPTSSPRTSQNSSSRTLPRQAAPKPEDHWAFVSLMFLMLAFKPCGCCNKRLWFKTFECL